MILLRHPFCFLQLVLLLGGVVLAARPLAASKPEKDERSVVYRFEGNSFLSGSALKKAAVDDLSDFKNKGRRRFQSDDAAYVMESAYRDRGFAFASVTDSRTESPEEIILTFTVEEGPRVLLLPVDVFGNEYYKSEDLFALFRSERVGFLGSGLPIFSRARVLQAVSLLERLYMSEGFREVKVQPPEITFNATRDRAKVVVRLEEGPRFLVSDIQFQGEILPEMEEKLSECEVDFRGKPFFPRRSLELKTRIHAMYGDRGYPESKVLTNVSAGENSGDVIIAVTIEKGPRVRVVGVKVRDREALRTQEWFIRRRVEFESGDLYSVTKERKSFQGLFRTGLFDKILFDLEPPKESSPEVVEGLHRNDEEDTVDRVLEIKLSELSSQEFFVEAGLGSYELLRGTVGFRDNNIFGSGRIFSTEARASFKGAGVLVSVTDPFFLQTDIRASIPLEYEVREEPSFDREDFTASLLFHKDFGKDFTTTLGYSYKVTNVSSLEFAPEDLRLENLYNIASLRLQFTYDTRNDLFAPTSGQRSSIGFDYADEVLGSEVDLFRLTTGTRWFLSLAKSTVLAVRYRTGFVIPIHDDDAIPIGERFFNGGENSVRSFRESELGPRGREDEPVGGEAFNVFNIELRQRLYRLFAGRLFFDYGNISPNETRFEEGTNPVISRGQLIDTIFREYFRDFRPALGIGVDYLLPIGPIRLDFAWNPDHRSERDEDRFRVHFALGMAF